MTSNERTQLILSLALGAAVFTAMNYDTSQVWLVILAGFLFVVVVSYVRRALAVRRMVRALRRLDPAFRRQVVNSINSESVRDYYDQRLRLEGDADVAGVVERYPFAPSDRSEQTRRYWTLMLVAGLALASPILWPHMAVWQRAIALTVVLICLGLLAMNRRRMRRLDTVLEVSPYGLAEIQPDGTRRVLTFNQPLACRVNRWRSRVEVAPVGGRQSDRIFVDSIASGSTGCSWLCFCSGNSFSRRRPRPPRPSSPPLSSPLLSSRSNPSPFRCRCSCRPSPSGKPSALPRLSGRHCSCSRWR
ncbi:MAG TPA: hypothetical protein VK733_00605 [Gemmatimonadaceae bacterium]|jgi:hypothetical protein|nr:hypothetical protein [Gemmatimonadaceae bacterium]